MDNINGIQAIATGNNLDHVPLQDEVVSQFGSDVWTAGGAPTDTPRMNVGLTDGVQTAWFLTSGNIRGWTGSRKLHINPTNYLRLNNPAAGGIQNLSYDGIQEKYIRGTSNVISGLVTLANGLSTTIQPPVGESWHVTDFASDDWVGIAPFGLPSVLVEIGDGVNWATICDGTNSRLWFTEDMGIYINNAIYLRITNNALVPAFLAWSGVRSNRYQSVSAVKSNVAVVLAGGAINISPVSTREEWLITGVFSSNLIGIAPDQLPDINVENNNGAILSLKLRNSDVTGWLHHLNIIVSSANYLTLTDTSGLGGVLAYSAYRTRM